MQQFIDEFKKYLLQQEMSQNTIRNYFADLTKFSQWYQNNCNTQIELKDITSYHIQTFKDYLINKKRLKTASVNRILQSLKRFYQFLGQQKILKDNPAAEIKFQKRAKVTKPSALNKTEVHALLSIAGRKPEGKQLIQKRNFAIIQLILQTGLRVSEVVNLQRQDISFSERAGQVRVVDGKGHKERIIPLNSTVRKALASYLDLREKLDPTEPIFISKRGQVPTTRAIQKIITTLATKANIDRIKVSPHTLRHTFATNYLRANNNCLVELAALLGHESLDTTAIYTKSSKERLAETLENAQFMHEML
jgi:integrase/recombinase XerC